MTDRYQQTVDLYIAGLSIQKIADRYGITRQAMWAILQRRGCQFRSHLRYGKANHFYRGTQAVDPAQNKLESAIRNGTIEQRRICEKCGASYSFRDGRNGVQAHHDDYSKPLEVRWLCQRCHHQAHLPISTMYAE
jgi:predicted DNA-binding protein YlxM (UPF0122 family)